ncbi:PREDICTED: leucine-rich repeat receptor-like serine/threonine/tyrosine-protein kinase SOBIR1 [Nelumbo nucifera]|uniref:Leucine-rich repeat receptor-like serine/threonine/tyrosine-protein kinase SOBIR1 n=1 Tax=Nelumbo nucifera TaxID=4432 RepID=A0A1U7ZRV4_NELNU|nr:PREDICTED: leucine-rich repeat receptor-like serine/threonine/tyrosine-protein kinase SOBIR1 [Nelumbo nucifera]
MVSLLHILHFFFLAFLSLSLLVHARLNLDPSDFDALSLIRKDLGGFYGQRFLPENPCNSAAGIFCERRYSGNSLVLRVTRIVLESQRLSGFLSPALGRLTELRELSLPNNQLVGKIPREIVDCRKLQILYLRNNHLSGKIPPEFSSLVGLRSLDLSSNRFSGDLSFLKRFPNLENLSLADNQFNGKIPASLRSFRNLRFLNLSGNNFLQGPVPASLLNRVEHSISGLETKNILPKRYIFAENSTKNNQTSVVAPPTSSKKNSTQAKAPSSSSEKKEKHEHQKNKKKLKGWIFGFFAGVAAGTVSGMIVAVLFKLLLVCINGRVKDSGPAIFSPLIKKAEDLSFLEKEDGLASVEIIGRGGCGEVYKAELPGSNGKIIAIKKVIQPNPMDAADLAEEESKHLTKKMRQIRSEIQTVGQIRHRNLLPLLAHVPRPDCHYLVYEYMKNGSLQDVLNQVSQGTRELDWLVRHKIALGVAAGLEYLHMNHSPRIIHRDLKPGNILLDDDMEARIADFGLAKAVPDINTHVTTSNVAGTVGYIAPEYHQTLKFTDKCDIYSFGVILAVLVVGKLPSDEFFQNTDEMSLLKWLRNVMASEDPKRAIDLNLMGNGFENQMLLVLKIACFCTLDDPKQRPNSKDVRCMLSQIER